jgi:hypothetical protein
MILDSEAFYWSLETERFTSVLQIWHAVNITVRVLYILQHGIKKVTDNIPVVLLGQLPICIRTLLAVGITKYVHFGNGLQRKILAVFHF